MHKLKLFVTILTPMLILAFSGCSKKNDSPTPVTPVPPVSPTPPTPSPYYFRFTLNAKTDTMDGDDSWSYSTNTNAIYGAINKSNSMLLTPSMSLRFKRPPFDTVTESDVLGLKGRTLYFTDSIMKPSFEYTETSTSDPWYSRQLVDSSFNVNVTDIIFLDTARYQGYPVRRYIITGNCRVKMGQNPLESVMTGSFKMMLTRVVY